jgi:DNA ligase-1
MIKLPTLYKRTKSGDIQFWEMSSHKGMEPLSTTECQGLIKKVSGKLGTVKPLVHQEVVPKGKNIGKANETTPWKQAELQARSDWDKKRDEGYKSLNDLGLKEDEKGGWSTDTAEAKYYGTLYIALQERLPQFNSDASGNVKPMLAQTYKEGKVKFPAFVQPKLDGVRCLMAVTVEKHKAGTNYTIDFLSRSGKVYETLSHIEEAVRENGPSESFILDGEIYSEELTFQGILKAVKKQRPESEKLHFRAYDIVMEGPMTERLQKMMELVTSLGTSSIAFVSTMKVTSHTELQSLHDGFVELGYEGAMLRTFTGTYGQGQRSSDLLKVKMFQEEEFEFVNWTHGQRPEDLIAVCKTKEGKEFRAKMMGNVVEKKEMEENTPMKITVKYFELTEDRIPRFPIGKAVRDYD